MAIAFKFNASANAIVIGAGISPGSFTLSDLFTTPLQPSGSENGSVTITVTEPDSTHAPCRIRLEATSVSGLASFQESGTTYDGGFHEYTYIWWVTGGPLPKYTAPVNMVTSWNEPNIFFGRKPAVVFPEAGSYTVELYVIDRLGNYANATSSTIVVDDQDSTFSGAATICISTSSDFEDAPSGSTQVSSLSAAKTAIDARSAPTRVLYRRGDTFTGQLRCDSGKYMDHVGVFGPEEDALPILQPTAYSPAACLDWSSGCANTQITIEHLDMDGPWDPVTERGYFDALPFAFDSTTAVDHVLLYKTDINGFKRCDLGSTDNTAAYKHVTLCDSIIENWADYGAWVFWNDTGSFQILGSRIVQDPDASQIISGKISMANQHGPCRIVACRDVYIDCWDSFSNNGWLLDVQPWLRVGTHVSRNTDMYFYMSRTVGEGGYQGQNFEGENTDAQDNPGNFVQDRVLIIGTTRNLQSMISFHKGGFTARNVYGFMPNVPHFEAANWPNAMFRGAPNNSQGTNNSEPVQLYSNTLVSLLDNTNDGSAGAMDIVGTTSPFSDVTTNNNVEHVPNASPASTSDAPIDITSTVPGVTPRFKGTRTLYDYPTGSDTVADDGTLVVSYSSILKLDREGNGPAGATDQTYWQTYPADTKHKISFGGNEYYADNGDFEVSFGASSVTITNRSGSTWTGTWYLDLDRTSHADTDIPLDTQYANPSTVPLGKPQSGSSALDTGTGRHSILLWDDDTKYRPVGNEDAGVHQVTT